MGTKLPPKYLPPTNHKSVTKAYETEFEGVPARGKINDLLYYLLLRGIPHGHEDLIIPTIRTLIRKWGYRSYVDSKNNLRCWIRTEKVPKPTTMFSSHLDTVHQKPDSLKIMLSTGPGDLKKDYLYALDTEGKRTILGADDKAGVYIMLRMIQEKIPGLYIFHAGEERGCIGSKYIVEKTPKIITGKGLQRCIAFDRMNYGDVINSQGGTCCSSEFANALAEQYNSEMNIEGKLYQYKPTRGVYTDSAEYIGLIPECTNLSVGYFFQHGPKEKLDLYWLEDFFIPTTLKIKWEKLPTIRKAEKPAYCKPYNHYDDLNRGYVSNTGYYPGPAVPHYLKKTPVWEFSMGWPLGSTGFPITDQDMRDRISRWNYKEHYLRVNQIFNHLSLLRRVSVRYEKIEALIKSLHHLSLQLDPSNPQKDVIQQIKTQLDSFINPKLPSVQHAQPISVNIRFDAEKFLASYNGKPMILYSKKGNPIQLQHARAGKLQKGTGVYVKLNGTLHCAHTVGEK